MKINEINKLSKFRNTKLYKGIVIGGCALTLITSLTACNKEKDPLDGTKLEDAKVVTYGEGTKDVAKIIGYCDNCDDGFHHYQSIVNGDIYTGENCGYAIFHGYGYVNKYHLVSEENIVRYMTYDELNKAMNNELNDEDINDIILRIQNITLDNNTKKYTK